MRKENRKIIAERGKKKAREDEINIKSILKHRDGTPSAACFLSQQTAEKYLKALLVFFDLELIKSHDLTKLASLLKNHASGIREISVETELLNQYYIETRYVGGFPEFSWRDAEEAYKAAKKIK